MIPACLALAGLSLLAPSEPSYDSWAWVVWGREVFELDLDTGGGPSWKPGTVLITTLFAPLGEIDNAIPPALWLVVARASGLLALYFAFTLVRRLGGGIVGGAVAVAALATLPLWLRYLLHGNEAPLAVALMLWAYQRHLDGRRDHAVLLLFAGCLFRPEVLPFLLVEAGLVFWKEPARRAMVAGTMVALPVLWLVPEWIGSGNPLDAGKQATSEPSWSLSRKDKPWLAAVERADGLAGLDIEIAALVGILVAAIRRNRAALVLAGIGVVWLGLIVAMTQIAFSGSNRYFLPPLVVACLMAGIGVGGVLDWVRRLARRFVPLPAAPAAAATAAAVAIGLLAYPWADDRVRGLGDQVDDAERRVRNQDDLVRAIDNAGGRDRVLGFGPPKIRRGFQPRLAWELHKPLRYVEKGVRDGLVFALDGSGRPKPGLRLVARSRRWQLFEHSEKTGAGRTAEL